MRLFRLAVPLSQEELAERIRSYPMRVSRIERGKSPPTDEEAAAIASALNVEPDVIFPHRPVVKE
jgi:transcriptional regulator with XRE-family HTH domain